MINKWTIFSLLVSITIPLQAQIIPLDTAFYTSRGVDSILEYGGDTLLTNALPAHLIKFYYDGNCQVTREAERYAFFNTWRDTAQMLYTYDSQRRVSIKLRQKMSSFGYWLTQSRILYTYTNNNVLPDSIIEQSFDAGTWTNRVLHQVSFNASAKLTQEIVKNWNISTRIWENYQSFAYDFNIHLQLLTATKSTWDGNLWQKSERNRYTYNAQNRLDTFHLEIMHVAGWLTFVTFPITVSSDGRKLKYQNNVSGIIQQREYVISRFGFLESITDLTKTDPILPFTLNIGRRERYVYNLPCGLNPTASLNSSKNTLVIAPNPVQATLNIDLNTLKSKPTDVCIYNAAGQLIEILPCDGSLHFQYSMEHLPNGLYLLAIRGDSWQSVQKFVVQH